MASQIRCLAHVGVGAAPGREDMRAWGYQRKMECGNKVGNGRRRRMKETHIALECSTVVDREDQDNVAASVVGFSEDSKIFFLSCPGALCKGDKIIGRQTI